MQSFELLNIGDLVEHEQLEGDFVLLHITPTVLSRALKLTSLNGWYAQGPRGVLISISYEDIKRGDIVRSSQHQGEFVVTLVAEQIVFVIETRLVTDPRGWWVKSHPAN